MYVKFAVSIALIGALCGASVRASEAPETWICFQKPLDESAYIAHYYRDSKFESLRPGLLISSMNRTCLSFTNGPVLNRKLTFSELQFEEFENRDMPERGACSVLRDLSSSEALDCAKIALKGVPERDLYRYALHYDSSLATGVDNIAEYYLEQYKKTYDAMLHCDEIIEAYPDKELDFYSNLDWISDFDSVNKRHLVFTNRPIIKTDISTFKPEDFFRGGMVFGMTVMDSGNIVISTFPLCSKSAFITETLDRKKKINDRYLSSTIGYEISRNILLSVCGRRQIIMMKFLSCFRKQNFVFRITGSLKECRDVALKSFSGAANDISVLG